MGGVCRQAIASEVAESSDSGLLPRSLACLLSWLPETSHLVFPGCRLHTRQQTAAHTTIPQATTEDRVLTMTDRTGALQLAVSGRSLLRQNPRISRSPSPFCTGCQPRASTTTARLQRVNTLPIFCFAGPGDCGPELARGRRPVGDLSGRAWRGTMHGVPHTIRRYGAASEEQTNAFCQSSLC
jgi:hypothetical protein